MKDWTPRPQSLAEIIQRVLHGSDYPEGLKFQYEFNDFLDEFYLEPREEMLKEEPVLLEGQHPKGMLLDVWLGAAAEFLADKYDLPIPSWCKNRKLDQPWYGFPFENMRFLLERESPPAFRKRNLFVADNVLSRA